MITNFDDFCTWMYVTIDDIWQKIKPLFTHPGSQVGCSDIELIALAIISECRGWHPKIRCRWSSANFRHFATLTIE